MASTRYLYCEPKTQNWPLPAVFTPGSFFSKRGAPTVCYLRFGLLILFLSGCAGITVREAGPPDLSLAWRDSSLVHGDVSARTLQTLRGHDLEKVYQRKPEEAFHRLRAITAKNTERDCLFALAEMSYVLGHHAERKDPAASCHYYFLCAGYAYHYLFEAVPDPPASKDVVARVRSELSAEAETAFDPRFRLACDLYNVGLARCLRIAQATGRLDSQQTLRLPRSDGKDLALPITHHGFGWQPTEFGPLLLCSDYRVVGLANQHHMYGLGVPLIGTRAEPAQKARPRPDKPLYPPNMSFPVTAFLRFEGTNADLENLHACRLELHNPLAGPTVQICRRKIPLEMDLTTPLAYFMKQQKLLLLGDMGFMNPDRVRDLTGFYLLEPYQPGKIPVILVHGLRSTPLTWATLFNDLRADSELRKHYQVWFYFYPTGDMYLAAAADLRDRLTRLRHDLDHEGRDPSLDQIVLVGHSLGGLVAKLAAVDSGDDFWRLVSSEPLESLNVSPETRLQLERIFFFQAHPSVRRVIFMGTLHHGAKMSTSTPLRMLASLTRPSQALARVADELKRYNPGVKLRLDHGLLLTGTDMAPSSPALKVLAKRPKPEGVCYHSIIGTATLADSFFERTLAGSRFNEDSDGVVSYDSAHLEGVDSEIVVPANHTHVKHHPLAIRELKRILLEHLAVVSRRRQPHELQEAATLGEQGRVTRRP